MLKGICWLVISVDQSCAWLLVIGYANDTSLLFYFSRAYDNIISSPYRYTLHTCSLILLVRIMLHMDALTRQNHLEQHFPSNHYTFLILKFGRQGLPTGFGISDINITFNQWDSFWCYKTFFAVKCSSMKKSFSIEVILQRCLPYNQYRQWKT